MAYDWQFQTLFHYWPVFVRGAVVTLELTFGGSALALILGLLMGLGKNGTIAPVRYICTAYVEFIRGTPALVQIVWIYYCFPIIFGLQMNGEITMIVALGIHSGAYVAEIFRAGVNAVDRGQFAASRALGMSPMLIMRRIILPQAIQKMTPPLINEFASLLKLTTLGSTIAVYELLHESNNLIASTYRPLEVYTALAVIFFIITYPFILMAQHLEKSVRSRG